ncbi:large conductance mechanosensitive channel protein MscL [Cellulomonas citrea]|uniref:large conductance mechanosensitive channel protein MscL n=1 Tax=Cellulomonas citrea TaxID=1909423 RepID=UPI001F458A7D|nr:large conductance mechanosensitive channel protein MscL [Cellulomonas citrea]
MSETYQRGVKATGGLLHGFKEFISRGSAIDLAVGVIIGAAFGSIVKALTDGVINPLIAALFGKPDISEVLTFPLNGATISIGLVLQAVLTFLITALALYFAIVLPINTMRARRARAVEQAPQAPSEEILLLTQIRDLLAEE